MSPGGTPSVKPPPPPPQARWRHPRLGVHDMARAETHRQDWDICALDGMPWPCDAYWNATHPVKSFPPPVPRLWVRLLPRFIREPLIRWGLR